MLVSWLKYPSLGLCTLIQAVLCFLTCSHLSLNILFSDTEYIPDSKSRFSSSFRGEENLEIKIQHYLCIFLVFPVFGIGKYFCITCTHLSIYAYLSVSMYITIYKVTIVQLCTNVKCTLVTPILIDMAKFFLLFFL